MKREHGIRVSLTLFIPHKKDDMASLIAAGAAAEKLCTREGLAELAKFPAVEIEEATAKNTTREIAG